MFYGSIPALVTPFSGNCVDEDSLGNFIDWQIGEGSNGLVPCGTTGEVATLDSAEHRRVVEIAVEVSKGRVPVIAGCGSYSTAAISRQTMPRCALWGIASCGRTSTGAQRSRRLGSRRSRRRVNSPSGR